MAKNRSIDEMRVLIRFQRRKSKKPSVVGYINGKDGSKEPVEEMSQQDLFETLDQLKNEFKEFEKIREGIGTRITSIAKLVPKLNERKELLEKDIDEKRKEVEQITLQIPKLSEKKVGLRESIQQMQEQKEELEKYIHREQEGDKEITKLINELITKRWKIEEVIQPKQEDLSRIDEQIKQIMGLQKYGIELKQNSSASIEAWVSSYLKEHKGRISIKDCSSELKIGETRIKEALEALEKRGKIKIAQ